MLRAGRRVFGPWILDRSVAIVAVDHARRSRSKPAELQGPLCEGHGTMFHFVASFGDHCGGGCGFGGNVPGSVPLDPIDSCAF